MLISNPRGNYRFLPGGDTFSNGVVAEEGYEIVHVTLRRPLPYREGFERIAAHLKEEGRGREALCAVELRIPAPLSRTGFAAFNAEYRKLMESWDLRVEGRFPVARTNVAPERNPPPEPSLFAFACTVPSRSPVKSFIVSGAGELRGGPVEEAAAIRPGETSPEAMAEKAAFVMKAMNKRLDGLGVTWAEVTTVNLYTVQSMEPWIGPEVLDKIGPAVHYGVNGFPARPPIDILEFEADVRGVATERILAL